MDKLESIVRDIIKEVIEEVLSEESSDIIKAQTTVKNLDKSVQVEKNPVRKITKKISLDRAKLNLYKELEDDAKEKQRAMKDELKKDADALNNAKLRDKNELPSIQV